MSDWIASNSEWLGVVANWTMVAIWVVYLQVFLRSFRRQTLPKIVINRAAGSSLGAACFVSNMSSDAIYIESVIVDVRIEDHSLVCTVTDFEFLDGKEGSADPKLRTFQGPLPPSQYTSLGTFGELLETTARRTGHDGREWKAADAPFSITITIIADYASEALLIGARRTFNAYWSGRRLVLAADKPSTEQIRSVRERRRIHNTLMAMEER